MVRSALTAISCQVDCSIMAIQMLGGLSEVLEVSAEVVAHRAQPTTGHTLVLSPAIVCLFPPYPDDLRHRAPLCVLFCLCGCGIVLCSRLALAWRARRPFAVVIHHYGFLHSLGGVHCATQIRDLRP